ncbi:unnamed protein product [Camellia sinensis]
MVSAIGNDGPLYGTLNNIQKIKAMLLVWVIPHGYGRVKPGVVAYGREIMGSKISTGCKSLSGTSVASPVVAASMKQALVEGAAKLSGPNMYEQGAGRVDLLASYQILKTYQPRASIFPSILDYTDCPYSWPFCHQPLCAGAMPVIFNATILNGMGVIGYVESPPTWHPSDEVVYLQIKEEGAQFSGEIEGNYLIKYPPGYIPSDSLDVQNDILDWHGDHLHTNFHIMFNMLRDAGYYIETLGSPFTCFYGIRILGRPTRQPPKTTSFWRGEGEEGGRRREEAASLPSQLVASPPAVAAVRSSPIQLVAAAAPPSPPPPPPPPPLVMAPSSPALPFLLLLLLLLPPPSSLFLSFLPLFLRVFFFLEICPQNDVVLGAAGNGCRVGRPRIRTRFYALQYGTLRDDVINTGIGLVVFAEWYNVDTMVKMRFFDDNTWSWWTPVTGGANVPALNDLLSPFGIAFGDKILNGDFSIDGGQSRYASGTNIVKFPRGGMFIVSLSWIPQSVGLLRTSLALT